MSKQIITIGYEIPGRLEDLVNFNSKTSLMDADIVLFFPEFWFYDCDNNYCGKTCYSESGSFQLKEDMRHWKKELDSFLKSGKTVFLFLAKKEEYYLHTGQKYYSGSGKSRVTTNDVDLHNNYEFLPIDIGDITSANGKQINFIGNPIFSLLYNKFKNNLTYQTYIEKPREGIPVFTGKDKTKILGAIYKIGSGHLITLPVLTFNEKDFTEVKKDEKGEDQEYWNKKGMQFGNHFVDCLLEIESKLTEGSKKTPTPAWVSQKQFSGEKEKKLYDSINKNSAKIIKIEEKNEKLKVELEKELELKDLLYEQGKPLEAAVITALKILGFQAENYDDGDLEIDQVITSPEKRRYIGECEGKDSKDIDITKLRQLLDSLNEDFARDEIQEKAFGILFGNPERLKDPNERKLGFTTKCKTGAKREKVALVRTVDLFVVAKYLTENDNEEFKKACREAIHSCLGEIVKFPDIIEKK